MDDISKKYNTFNFNGTEWPTISEKTRDDLWKLANGNFTTFGREFLGSTFHFLKTQSFELQCTAAAGREGGQILSNAIAAGIIKHPILSTAVANPWYICVPTVLPYTQEDSDQIDGLAQLGKGGYFNTGKDNTHLYCDMIISGFDATNSPGKSAKEAADGVANNWSGTAYLRIVNQCWDDILNY